MEEDMRQPGAKVLLVALTGAGLLGSFVAGRLTPAGAASRGASSAARPAAALAVTPGWECVPTTAGQAVISGGTGAAPSCVAGTSAVLAPTYVSSGVGGKPTVVFSAVNLQVVSGSGSTSAAVNGEGNLVVGYAENLGSHRRTGSNNLIVGSNDGWTSYGSIVGGSANSATGPYATVFGTKNTGSGHWTFVAGQQNRASGRSASVLGGDGNDATANCQAIPAAPGVC
jgi:hypothetical protein